jgi:ribosomal protein L11 methyltransferase
LIESGRVWTEVAVEAPAGLESEVAAALCAAGAGGAAASEGPGGAVLLRAYFAPPGPATAEEVRRLLAGAPEGVRVVAVGAVEDGLWVERWTAGLAPFDVGERFTVHPIAQLEAPPGAAGPRGPAAPGPAGGRIVLRVCPSRAFGTGDHATTRLCLEAMEAIPLEGKAFLDAGTGSGILAVAAARLGAARVVALDIDPEAVEVARANARLNGCAAAIEFRVADAAAAAGGPFDSAAANLDGPSLERALGPLAAILAPGGRLVASGLLEAEAMAALDRACSFGLRAVRAEAQDGWACLTLAAGAPAARR